MLWNRRQNLRAGSGAKASHHSTLLESASGNRDQRSEGWKQGKGQSYFIVR
jgi:hypothetical protein